MRTHLTSVAAALFLAAAALAGTTGTALMAQVFNISSRTYAPGTYHLGPTNISNGDNFVVLLTSANNWTAGITMTVLLEQSDDGGVTWREDCGFTSVGPIASTDQGWQCGLFAPPVGQTYEARATITTSGGSLTTPVTIETTTAPVI